MSVVHCFGCDVDYDTDFDLSCPRECEHVSWCAVHNAPALPVGFCDCGANMADGPEAVVPQAAQTVDDEPGMNPK